MSMMISQKNLDQSVGEISARLVYAVMHSVGRYVHLYWLETRSGGTVESVGAQCFHTGFNCIERKRLVT